MNTAMDAAPVNKNSGAIILVAGFIALLATLSAYWLQYVDWQTNNSIQLGWAIIAQYLGLSLAMLLFWLFGPKTNNWRDYRNLLLLAVLLRVLLIPVTPYTSNDTDRYLFDGKLALSGFDPYRTTHDIPEVAQLRQQWPTPAEHAKYPTLYPPAAIALYAVTAAAGPTYAPLMWKFLVSIAGLATLFIMTAVLGRIRRLKHLSLIAFSPILVLETGIGAHVDVFTSLCVAGAIFLLLRRKRFTGTAIIALGALIKLLPAVLMAVIVAMKMSWLQRVKLAITFFLVMAAGYGVVLMLGMQPIGSTPVFFEKWRNGAPLFDLLATFITAESLPVVILSVLLIGLLCIAYITWRSRAKRIDTDGVVTAMQWSLALVLLLSPVVFPWYLMPLIPLFALKPSVFLAAWMTLLPLTYVVLNEFACCGVWQPPQWPLVLLGAGLVLGAVIDCRDLWKNKTQELSHA